MRLFTTEPSHPLIKINESQSCYGELLQKKLCSSFAFERILHLEDSLALLHLKCLLAILHLKYPKFCIGFKIRKADAEQLLLSSSGHSK